MDATNANITLPSGNLARKSAESGNATSSRFRSWPLYLAAMSAGKALGPRQRLSTSDAQLYAPDVAGIGVNRARHLSTAVRGVTRKRGEAEEKRSGGSVDGTTSDPRLTNHIHRHLHVSVLQMVS